MGKRKTEEILGQEKQQSRARIVFGYRCLMWGQSLGLVGVWRVRRRINGDGPKQIQVRTMSKRGRTQLKV